MPLRVTLPDGSPGDPQSGITPIFAQLESGHRRVIGTGFFVARYGLFLTAKHVVEDIVDFDQNGKPCLTWNWTSQGKLYIQPIIRCTFPTSAPRHAADIAICQAVASAPDGQFLFGEPNERIALVSATPEVDAHVGTYAYPGNASVDFRNTEDTARIFADCFEGKVLEIVGPADRFLKCDHIETSMEIRAGASGGPVFTHHGHAFAVNCRAWDFARSDDSTPLSSIVPIKHILDLEFPFPQLPPTSAEARSVPAARIGSNVTLRDLASWNHVVIDPPEPPNNALERTRQE
jgi:hypothetical protein